MPFDAAQGLSSSVKWDQATQCISHIETHWVTWEWLEQLEIISSTFKQCQVASSCIKHFQSKFEFSWCLRYSWNSHNYDASDLIVAPPWNQYDAQIFWRYKTLVYGMMAQEGNDGINSRKFKTSQTGVVGHLGSIYVWLCTTYLGDSLENETFRRWRGLVTWNAIWKSGSIQKLRLHVNLCFHHAYCYLLNVTDPLTGCNTIRLAHCAVPIRLTKYFYAHFLRKMAAGWVRCGARVQ